MNYFTKRLHTEAYMLTARNFIRVLKTKPLLTTCLQYFKANKNAICLFILHLDFHIVPPVAQSGGSFASYLQIGHLLHAYTCPAAL